MGLFAGTPWDLPAHCEKCGNLEANCSCPPATMPVKSPSTQTLKVRIEKRKGGRIVTVIEGLTNDDPTRSELMTRLKNACGAGGTIEPDHLIVQGDQQQKATKLLKEIGFRVKS